FLICSRLASPKQRIGLLFTSACTNKPDPNVRVYVLLLTPSAFSMKKEYTYLGSHITAARPETCGYSPLKKFRRQAKGVNPFGIPKA
ncbi:MAG TPA: hypothetical protein PK263_01290, partial [bacterium]|nr:hypothetical protein [bacterium]